jgi:hypothetical protein
MSERAVCFDEPDVRINPMRFRLSRGRVDCVECILHGA